MKKLILGLAALLAAGSLTAGSVDYLSNQSADYLRTFSRNASLDADAAVYNPAGTAFLTPGLTFALSNQTVWKLYEAALGLGVAAYDKNYTTEEPTLVLPNGQLVFNGGAWAGYLSAGITAGGGSVDYADGIPTMPLYSSKIAASGGAASGGYINGALWNTGDLQASSLYPQVTLGGSFAFFDALSVAAGARYVSVSKAFTGEANYTFLHNSVPTTSPYPTGTTLELDAIQAAQGFGGVFGVAWKLLPGLMVSGRYETATALEFETTVKDGKNFGGLFTDGKKEQKDLPALAGVGARFDWEGLTVTGSGTLYFLDASRTSTYLKDYADYGWEAGASLEYALLPGFLKLSAGALMTTSGASKDTYTDFDFALDSKSVGGGLVLTVIKDLDLTVAVSKTLYTASEGNKIAVGNYPVDYSKDATTLAVSCQYRLF